MRRHRPPPRPSMRAGVSLTGRVRTVGVPGWARVSRLTTTAVPPDAAVAAPSPPPVPRADSPPLAPSTPGAARRSSAYPFANIEARWQAHWEARKTFRTPSFDQLDTSKPKAYVLDMFPYPSGAGLHVGHPEGYTATDIVARYKRMTGHNVLHPIGWDAFGLPAEQYAIQTGQHPAKTTATNISRFRSQLKSLGFSYDWEREVDTTDPSYYKWTQWIFLKLWEKGLAYQAEVPVNWSPALGTVLANEEVINGLSERGNHPVVRKPMRQWMLRITEYADRLLEGLDRLDWDDNIKDMQRNWIGRSEGVDIVFGLVGGEGAALAEGATLTTFTTRADTIFGVTYVCVAPEHPLMSALTTPACRADVDAYVAAAAGKSDLERAETARDRRGVPTGSVAIHPVTGAHLPVWVADYVLGAYGSGAVMAVPAHDARDAAFAATHALPVVTVVQPKDGEGGGEADASTPLPFTDDGVVVASSGGGLDLSGLDSATARARVGAFLASSSRGGPRVNYKLRDWLFARQRYWGEPFPMSYDAETGDAVPLPDHDLPLLLPVADAFHPTGSGDPPLAGVPGWMHHTGADGRALIREASTMPQWAGSCWYYIRYVDPSNPTAPVDPAAAAYWLPVDLYVGGAEHAVLHLLYARFWHKVLFDVGVVPTDEPFTRLVSQGMILGEVEYTAWRAADGAWANEGDAGAEAVAVSEADTTKGDGGRLVLKSAPHARVSARAHKMSKSRGNVVNPDDVVYEFGADSLRLYEMFMGPLRDTKVWSTRSVDGVHRFLARVHSLTCDNASSSDAITPTRDQLRLTATTIKRVTDDTEGLRFNTAISAMMEFVNGALKWPEPRPRAPLRTLALLLAPYAPHLAEEAWASLGGEGDTLTYEAWPIVDDPSLLVADTVTVGVQVGGKTRGTVDLPAGAAEADAVAAARALAAVERAIGDADVKKVVYVPGRIINFICAGGGGKKK